MKTYPNRIVYSFSLIVLTIGMLFFTRSSILRAQQLTNRAAANPQPSVAVEDSTTEPLLMGQLMRFMDSIGWSETTTIRAISVHPTMSLAGKSAPSGTHLMILDLALENRNPQKWDTKKLRFSSKKIDLRRSAFVLEVDGKSYRPVDDYSAMRTFSPRIEIPGDGSRATRGKLVYVIPGEQTPTRIMLRLQDNSTIGEVPIYDRTGSLDEFMFQAVGTDGAPIQQGVRISLRSADSFEAISSRSIPGSSFSRVVAKPGTYHLVCSAPGFNTLKTQAQLSRYWNRIVLQRRLKTNDTQQELLEELNPIENYTHTSPVDQLAESFSKPGEALRFVRDEITLIPSDGLVRGAVGTAKSHAGGPADRAVLLGELLQKMGYQIRYAWTTLTADEAATLYTSVKKPEVRTSTTEIGNGPINAMRQATEEDANIVLEALAKVGVHGVDLPTSSLPRKYVWVQRKDGSRWVDLDPRPGASDGQPLREPVGFADDLSDLTWKVTVSLELETIATAEDRNKITELLRFETNASELNGQSLCLDLFQESATGPAGLSRAVESRLLGALGSLNTLSENSNILNRDRILTSLYVVDDHSGFRKDGKSFEIGTAKSVRLKLKLYRPGTSKPTTIERVVYQHPKSGPERSKYRPVVFSRRILLSCANGAESPAHFMRKMSLAVHSQHPLKNEIGLAVINDYYDTLRAKLLDDRRLVSLEPTLLLTSYWLDLAKDTDRYSKLVYTIDLVNPPRRGRAGLNASDNLRHCVKEGITDLKTELLVAKSLWSDGSIDENSIIRIARFSPFKNVGAARRRFLAFTQIDELSELKGIAPELFNHMKVALAKKEVIMALVSEQDNNQHLTRFWTLNTSTGRFTDVTASGGHASAEAGAGHAEATKKIPAVQRFCTVVKRNFIGTVVLGILWFPTDFSGPVAIIKSSSGAKYTHTISKMRRAREWQQEIVKRLKDKFEQRPKPKGKGPC